MRKIILTLTALLCGMSAFLQTSITVDFGIIQNGNQLVLDSVLIQNQTVGCDTMIYNSQAGLTINVISRIDNFINNKQNLSVMQNYPNPCTGETMIEAWIPGQEAVISVFDITGKLVLSKKFSTGQGNQTFSFTPGNNGNFIVSFKSQGQEASIVVTSNSANKTDTSIIWNGKTDFSQAKSHKSIAFVYNQGDILNFTGYVTACQEAASTSISESPLQSQTCNFDFTYISDIQPNTPTIADLVVGTTSIDWNWNDATGANGYKYNFENDYSSAIDLGLQSHFLQNDLIAGTHYHIWVWAYNNCGESFALPINNATQAIPLNAEEIELILSGTSSQAMNTMSICAQPDSLVLRIISTNVIIGDENLQYLIDRMKTSVLLQGGVGIAAPQAGINRNIFWIKRYDKGGPVIKPWECYLNPRITAYSNIYKLQNDGCLSVGPECISLYSIAGNSWRATWVDVEYYLPDGTFVQERITHEYTAHIFQHELDHLNGILYFDRQVNPNAK